ncbi:MAG: metallopeptidase family protein [Nitrospinota bacterium]
MNRDAFLGLVEEVVEEVFLHLDSELGERPENVEICVEDWPTEEVLREVGVPAGGTLFGLYQGIPRTERSFFHDATLPDRIIIYQGPVEEGATTPGEIRKQVRHTIVHEIAHHFGISDERLMDLDAY